MTELELNLAKHVGRLEERCHFLQEQNQALAQMIGQNPSTGCTWDPDKQFDIYMEGNGNQTN